MQNDRTARKLWRAKPMNRRRLLIVCCMVAAEMAALSGMVLAQGPPPGRGRIDFVGPDPQDAITFVGFEAGLGNQIVAGAPYSAIVTSEFQQMLSDGNKIERKTSTPVYRDGQGRTRREQTLPAIGQYAAAAAPQVIFINDPVAGVSYILDPGRKLARKIAGRPGRGGGPLGRGPAGPGRGGSGPDGAPRQFPNLNTESLGSKNIEGLLVQGTRVTRTVPTGAVGNQNPIHVTSERWYSPDLKLNLLVKNNNPQASQTTTTLSNIRREEPDAALFQVPADYTIQDTAPRGRRGGPPPPPQP
jgi:hypothetical protein